MFHTALPRRPLDAGVASGTWVPSAAVVLVLAMWWLARPYAGIQHDAVYYAADALRHLHPAALGHDLFFHRLSQGDFSWFGSAYAALIARWDLDPAAWFITGLSRVAWCAALWFWCRSATAGRPVALMFAALLCLPSGYGALGALTVAEPFATPRPLAEALVLLALGLALRQRPGVAGLALMLAFATHPLMALGGSAVLVGMLPARLRTSALIAAALALAVLAWLGLQPFVRVTAFYDAAWWQIVERENPMTVFSRWTATDMGHAAVAWLLLGDAARCTPAASLRRRMALALAISVLVALGAWAWATETHHVLLVQLQLWRVLWLAQVLAPALWLAGQTNSEMPRPTWVTGCLLGGAWLLDTPAAVVLAALGLWQLHTPADRLPAAVQRWLPVFAGLLGVGIVAGRLEPLVNDPGLAVITLPVEQSVARVLHEPVVPLLVICALAAWHARGPQVGQAGPWLRRVVGAAALGATLALWSAWMLRAPDSMTSLARSAANMVPPGATVWSDAGLRWTWLRLQHASWVSYEQRAGALFSREAAMTWQRRWTVLRSLGLTAEPGSAPAPLAQRVRVLCAQPDLTTLLLTGEPPGADASVTAPGTRARMSLFHCQTRRSPS